MNRRQSYAESMLRHLGSVYYQTLQGQASAADVARAVESVRAAESAGGAGTESMVPAQASPGGMVPHLGRWRVSDVMTTEVITVDRNMPHKQVAQLMAERGLSAVPVVSGGGRVLGMISDADLLRKEERSFGRLGTGLPRRTRREREQAEALTATELMSAPPVTIHPEAPIGAAVRLLNGHRFRQLPVVDPAGQLIGIVSRHDLLKVFLRPDSEIAAEVRSALTSILLAEPERVEVDAADGLVTLTGELPRAEQIEVAVRLAADVEGVVSVTSRLTAERSLQRHG